VAQRGVTERLEIVLPEAFRSANTQTQPTTTSQGRKTGDLALRRMRKNGDQIANFNFKSMAKVGLAIRGFRMGNEIIGSYTGNTFRQRQVNTGMLFGSYAIGIAKFGAFGLAYASIDLGYRGIMHQIEVGKQDMKADILARKSGNNRTNNNRPNGRFL
jgi:hypothetical protein